MYVLNRLPQVITKRDSVGPGEVIETLYEYRFEFMECIGDKFRYKITRHKHNSNMLSTASVQTDEFNVMINIMSELNDLYNNPEMACDFMRKQTAGYKFVSFEILPEKSKLNNISNASFAEYRRTRLSFGDMIQDHAIIYEMINDGHYKGYAFIREDWKYANFNERYEDDITKAVKRFTKDDK